MISWQALVSMLLLLAGSIYWIRRRHYETFLMLHVALSFLALMAMLG